MHYIKKEVTQCLYFIKMSFIISWIEKMNILYIEERKFEEDRKNTDERSNRRYFAE